MPRLASIIDTLMDRTVAPGYTRLGPAVRRHLSTWPADAPPDALAGKRALVTGASSGLGIATAEGLAGLGAEVVLVVRDTDKGAAVVREIQGRLPLARFDVQRCDLADLDDVRRFAGSADDHVDVLVHNAGAMPPTRTESPQGHEMTMALHVLAPVLMTELMSERLRGGRVILVTSGGMYGQRLRADDPEYLDGDYSPTTAYARSKRAQVELLPVLQQRWSPWGIDVHATHPGWADTPGVTESLPTFRKLTGPLLRDAAGGAETTVWLSATSPAPEGGRLWHDRQPRPTHLLRRTRTGDDERDRMWAWVAGQLEL
ncbi:dehydrogenase [Nocardioides sp. Root1257]|uniref:SDR family NAD(P)-dependent oxidoreductase n=1 Tax=unclassified Nocardioides TaxID=2615069 RepID=UPI0006F993DD|nr:MULTISPECIES: SDR family NAD(P)-dependent oxidoreductase [unclassified Nocardioides]KQW48984.1 dehydrogenase [Nocardioides sp. Root1257]KRC48158.1 dehydrogenase [Nocardioides sp. Root224]